MASSELAAQPMIMTSAPDGIRSLIEQACRGAGVTFEVVAETSSMEAQKTLVAHGHGFAVLPALAVANDVARGELRAGSG
jgi:LysR family transcriptional regulator, nitrogen assimilation regulatory protein